jgi:hypothetical protein
MITGSLVYGYRQNKLFENITEFRCFGTAAANRIYIHSEVQRRINLEIVRFHSVGFFCPVSRNMKIKI